MKGSMTSSPWRIMTSSFIDGDIEVENLNLFYFAEI